MLTRSPLGVVGSFTRSGLFARWGYAERYCWPTRTHPRPVRDRRARPRGHLDGTGQPHPQNRLPLTPEPALPVEAGDDLFATTNHKTSLAAPLTQAEAAQVITCTAETLAATAGRVPPSVLDRATTWLTGAEHYQLAEKPKPSRNGRGRTASPPAPDVAYVYLRGLDCLR